MVEPPPPPRRRPFWKIALAVLALLLVAWGISTLVIGMVAEARWGDMKDRWKGLLEEARGRDKSRPALRGEAAAGNAWDDYAIAIREVRTLYELESSAPKNYLES